MCCHQSNSSSQRYAEKNITSPMGAIWCHHVMNGNEEIAQDVWLHFIQNNEHIYYWPIITKAKRDSNEAILHELIECLQSYSEAGRRNLDSAYSTLMGIYVRSGRFDEAMKIVEETKVRSGKLNRLTTGKTFPYKIPSRGHKVVLGN